jgi:hypothetical protein
LNTSVSQIGPNILCQDYLKLRIKNGLPKEMYYALASDSVFKYFGFQDANPWRKQQRIAEYTYTMDKNKEYKKGDRMEATYYLEIGSNAGLKGIQLVIERPWLYTVTLNGTRIQPEKGESWLDPAFAVFKVEKLLKKGKNEVKLVADPFSVHCELEPIYLLGNFNVESSKSGWKVAAPAAMSLGSWKSQGRPFFGQSVKYSKTISVGNAGKFQIELPNWFGTVAGVNINGKEAGIIETRPAVFNTELNSGENTIDIIVNGSLNNTFGPHHGNIAHGIGGRPDNFHKNGPKIQPEGKDYNFIDYGLMEDFKVYELR